MFKTEDVIVYMAGAGAGKTTALMKELEKALNKYRPDEIAFVSFSRKAAAEARTRAVEVAKDFDTDNYPYFKTLHSLTYMINNYQEENKKIIGIKESKYFGENTQFKFNIHSHTEGQGHKQEKLGQVCFDFYSLERSCGKAPSFSELIEQKSYTEFKELYNKFKSLNNLVDYHDCLDDYLNFGEPVSKIKFALIDEAQDLTVQQWQVCFKLFEKAESIRIAGDDWQAIYKYQGSSPEMFIQIANKYKIKRLENSYRLPVRIADFAGKISDKLQDKIDKKVIPVKKEAGNIIFMEDVAMLVPYIDGVTDDSWYILVRANYQIREIADFLKKKLVLFHYSNGFCLPQKELEKLYQYYRWSKNVSAPYAEKFKEKYGIKEEGWPLWHETSIISSKWRYIIKDYENKYGFDYIWQSMFKKEKVLLTTVFKVKGGEADNVAILTATTRKIEAARFFDNDNELRILYTAVTRSKKNLYFFNTTSEFNMYNRIKYIYNEVVV